ncbi:FHA domain-containing protein [Nocardia yamanashiensis]|uniref:FHA domain-containing protein n=1 Tax=Nocardia yamanashiensis TaxID=209247 RepID=UPI0008377312|nr:FHA domain-containing protein [Nocardia yamanashiensis]
MTGRVEVLPGGHLVACVDGVVLVVAHREDGPVGPGSESIAVLDKLGELVQEAAARETRRTGRTFARLVSTWLMGREDEEQVEFGVLTPGSRALAVFLHGGITAILEGEDGRVVLHGSDAGFTVDRVVDPIPARAAAVFVDEDPARDELPAPGVWSLREGRMPGSGAVLWLGDSDVSAASNPRIALRERPVKASDNRDVSGPKSPVAAANAYQHAMPSASGAEAQATPARVRSGVVVRGFKCARGHLNDPRVSFCTTCGIRMDQSTCVLVEGARPPLGVLLLDDGNSYVLDEDLVIGREPERSERVRRGAKPVRLADVSGGMSRVHAEIRLTEWEVTVLDRGSANGTHIKLPGRVEWARAVPGHPVALEPGSQVMLGGRVFTFDSQHQSL